MHEAEAELIRAVKSVGLEACATLGMLEEHHARSLRHAGLDYYNHNLDSAPDFYGQIITTRDYQARLDTLQRVRDVGLNVCCGGIVGMGESRRQRAERWRPHASFSTYAERWPMPLGLDAFPDVHRLCVRRYALRNPVAND